MQRRRWRHYVGVSALQIVASGCSVVADTAPAARAEFEVAFEAEAARLFAIAFSILRDPLEAEDAVQDCAAAAWRAWASRIEPSRTRAWLTTICVRQALRHRLRLFRWILLDGLDRKELAAATRHLEGEGSNLDLHRVHASLSPRQRAVITLHYQHGYTLAECGELMCCSSGAVASHLSRALARLRRELRDV